ncbi:MAG: hypothetical protein KKD39_05305 [Candidatus Altiarchaeota archaeon]|nr:hypothetical protein [Candidatus Altiarchaeota archaeon]
MVTATKPPSNKGHQNLDLWETQAKQVGPESLQAVEQLGQKVFDKEAVGLAAMKLRNVVMDGKNIDAQKRALEKIVDGAKTPRTPGKPEYVDNRGICCDQLMYLAINKKGEMGDKALNNLVETSNMLGTRGHALNNLATVVTKASEGRRGDTAWDRVKTAADDATLKARVIPLLERITKEATGNHQLAAEAKLQQMQSPGLK